MISHLEPNVLNLLEQFLKQDKQGSRTQQTRAVKSIPDTTQPSKVRVKPQPGYHQPGYHHLKTGFLLGFMFNPNKWGVKNPTAKKIEIPTSYFYVTVRNITLLRTVQ